MIFLWLVLFGGALVAWAQWVEPNWFRLTHEEIRLPKRIPRPFTVLHLSDLHFTRPRFFLSRFFDRLAKLETDFVFVTGDLIDSPAGIGPCVDYLKKLKPRCGTYLVLGNHDYRTYPFIQQWLRLITRKHYGADRKETGRLKEALVGAGFHLLENENVSVPIKEGEAEAVLVGIDDPMTGHADFERAFLGIGTGALRMALIHWPGSFPLLEGRGLDLVFSGHTHGGQIRLPTGKPLSWVHRLEPIIDSTDQYGFRGIVSRGLAANPSIRVRLFCRPEASLFRVKGAES